MKTLFAILLMAILMVSCEYQEKEVPIHTEKVELMDVVESSCSVQVMRARRLSDSTIVCVKLNKSFMTKDIITVRTKDLILN